MRLYFEPYIFTDVCGKNNDENSIIQQVVKSSYVIVRFPNIYYAPHSLISAQSVNYDAHQQQFDRPTNHTFVLQPLIISAK